MAYGDLGTANSGSPPTCRVTNSLTQLIPHITVTALTWDTNAVDPTGMHSTSVNTSRITIASPGMYVVTAAVEFVTGTDWTIVDLLLKVNGTTYIAKADIGTLTVADDGPNLNASTLWKFAANDYVEAYVYHRNGAVAARNVLANTVNTPVSFAVMWMGRGA